MQGDQGKWIHSGTLRDGTSNGRTHGKTVNQTQLGLIYERRLDTANALQLMAYGGALLKLAATDPRAYEILKQAWAMGQKDKPRAFEDASISPQTKASPQGEIE